MDSLQQAIAVAEELVDQMQQATTPVGPAKKRTLAARVSNDTQVSVMIIRLWCGRLALFPFPLPSFLVPLTFSLISRCTAHIGRIFPFHIRNFPFAPYGGASKLRVTHTLL